MARLIKKYSEIYKGVVHCAYCSVPIDILNTGGVEEKGKLYHEACYVKIINNKIIQSQGINKLKG